MAKRSLKDLQNHIDKESNKGGGSNTGFFYPHWKLPKDGETHIRVSEDPNQENPLIVYIEYLEHKLHIGDEWVRVPCVKNLGKDHNCPLCEHSQKLYKAKDEDAGKYFYREQFALLRGVITKDGLEYTEEEEAQTGQERPFKFSYQLAGAFKTEIGKLDGEIDEFWSLSNGFDFEIVKQMVKGKGDKEYGKYDVGSGFARRSNDVSEYSESVTDEPLSALIPEIPTYDEAAATLERYFRSALGETTSSSSGSDGDSDGDMDQDALYAKLKRNKQDRKEESTDDNTTVDDNTDAPPASDDDKDDDPLAALSSEEGVDDDDDILQQLKG